MPDCAAKVPGCGIRPELQVVYVLEPVELLAVKAK
jgi:hypothetical protein